MKNLVFWFDDVELFAASILITLGNKIDNNSNDSENAEDDEDNMSCCNRVFVIAQRKKCFYQ